MDGDSIKATPQSSGMGLFANALSGANSGLNSSGLGWVSDFLALPAASSLAQDMSYGNPPYRGSGMATRVDPRVATTLGAGLGTAGMLPLPASVASKIGMGVGGAALQSNETLDSVIQEMLNKLAAQTKAKR